jgi:Protein of unknown function (DUF3551)
MLDLDQGTFKPGPDCLLVPQAFVQSEAKMRFVLLGLVGAAAVLGTPAQAQNYPWCAQYSGRALGGAMNCGFVSFAQCMATVSGIGGFCIQNNTYQPPARRARKKKTS